MIHFDHSYPYYMEAFGVWSHSFGVLVVLLNLYINDPMLDLSINQYEIVNYVHNYA